MARRQWHGNFECHCCGKRFRTLSAEAKHRHNFPAMCNKNSATWKRFQKELADERAAKAAAEDKGE